MEHTPCLGFFWSLLSVDIFSWARLFKSQQSLLIPLRLLTLKKKKMLQIFAASLAVVLHQLLLVVH